MTKLTQLQRRLLADRIREIPVEIRAQVLKLVHLRKTQAAQARAVCVDLTLRDPRRTEGQHHTKPDESI